jgi:hypothetical protein
MVEYTIDEALELLLGNLEKANGGVASVDEDLAWLREQLTTTEVSMARLHNYEVQVRRKTEKKE